MKPIPKPNSIDYLRILGISFVILGHLYYEPGSIGKKFDAWIYTFHMPLFFVISGLLHKDGFKKNLNTLLSMILIFLIFNIPYIIKNPSNVQNILYKFSIPNTPTWFFIILGLVKFICYKITPTRGFVLISISIVFIVVYHNYEFDCYRLLLPLSMAIPFYVLTVLYKDTINNLPKNKILMYTLLIFSVCCSLLHGRCDMYNGIYWKSIIFYIFMAYSAILPLLSFTEYLSNKNKINSNFIGCPVLRS